MCDIVALAKHNHEEVVRLVERVKVYTLLVADLRQVIVKKDMMIGRMAERLECLEEGAASLGTTKVITKEEWRENFK